MNILRRLSGTIRVISCALYPVSSSATAASPYCHCCDFNSALDKNGHVELFFPDCYFPAAVALLFRLKRQGFTDCSATVNNGGILVTASR